MLKRLSIKNYALIDNLEITFSPDLNIITGETGAGKSIILGAISLILGQRAESKYFFNQQKKCIIEGVFYIANYNLKNFFEEENLDYEEETILRREISIDGKSRAFINDTPVNLTVLKSLGERLIDIHSQHAIVEINNPQFQLMVLDAYVNHQHKLIEYAESFKLLKVTKNKLKELNDKSAQFKADLDYFNFQFTELNDAKLEETEQEQIEQEISILANAEEIKTALLNTVYLLNDAEASVQGNLKTVISNVQQIEKFNEKISQLHERLQSTLIEIKDISDDLSLLETETFVNEEKLTALNDRLNLLYHLQNKHRVNTIPALIEIRQNLQERLSYVINADDEAEKINKEIIKLNNLLQQKAIEISATRAKFAPEIENYIETLLNDVGMPETKFSISIKQKENLDSTGADNVKFLFSANKGQQLNDLNKIASGGELSRLMLAVKSLIAKKSALPAIIFDEIDTGISGEVSNKVGNVMEKLAADMQVIAITHLPQIASKGTTHFYVYKDDQNNQTTTHIKKLSKEERITEIAKMISGENPGKYAFENAKELLS